MIDQWQYTYFHVGDFINHDVVDGVEKEKEEGKQFGSNLDEMGKSGWEFCGCMEDLAVFKKRLA